jgi:anti-sigma factor RsiW
MECRDVRDLGDSFLAEELLTETNEEILRHLNACSACRAEIAARRGLREALRAAIVRAHDLDPRPEFLTELRTQLQTAAGSPAGGRRVSVHRWWALAATIVIAAAAGLVYRSQSTTAGALARAAVGDHRDCALQPRLPEPSISLEAATERYGAVYRIFEGLPPTDINTAAGPAHVVRRHACVYQGRRFAHVILQYRGELISLLVTAADEDGGASASSRVDGLNVVSFRAGRQIVFVTGDVSADDLTALADAVAEPLGRELGRV